MGLLLFRASPLFFHLYFEWFFNQRVHYIGRPVLHTFLVCFCRPNKFLFVLRLLRESETSWFQDVPGCSRMSLLHCTNMIQYDPMVCMFFPTGFGGYVAGAKHSSQPEAWKQCEKCHLRIVAILMVPFPGVKPIFDVLKPSVLFDTCRKSPIGFALLGVNYQQLLIGLFGLFGSIWSLCLCSVEWTYASMWEWNMGEIILEVLTVLKWMAW